MPTDKNDNFFLQVFVEVTDRHGAPVNEARVVWYLGHGLDNVVLPVDPKGRVTLWAPMGETLVLRAVDSTCGQVRFRSFLS
jgi:hypothetical protein